MLKAMFEQFISEYEIYPYSGAISKEANKSRYICKSDKTSILFYSFKNFLWTFLPFDFFTIVIILYIN